MDLNAALRGVAATVASRTGRSLREPEIIILTGTWRGLTYQQIAAGSEYSTNYLMRDVAPKLWKRLSSVFCQSIGKTNFRVVIESQEISSESSPTLTLDQTDSQSIDQIAEPMPRQASTARSSSLEDTLNLSYGDRNYGSERESESIGFLGLDFGPGPLGTSFQREPIEVEKQWQAVSPTVLSAASLRPVPIYGYEEDLARIEQWLAEAADESGSQSRLIGHLIGIWGLRGIGKTLLVETAIARQGERFDQIVWRSLRDMPTVNELSISILSSLGLDFQPAQAVDQLLQTLTHRPLLLVMEDVESILEPNCLAGDYRSTYQSATRQSATYQSHDYRNYRDFFKAIADTCSCVLLVGIEGPAEIVREGYSAQPAMRSHFLTRLSESGAIALLQAESLTMPDQWPALIERYQAHPLALKLAARIIKDIFNGRVDTFLSESSPLFNDIFSLFDPSFARLSETEISIFYWLASQDGPLSLAELKQSLTLQLRAAELISALDSLKQRSLLTIDRQSDPPSFYLPELVKTFAIQKLVSQFSSSEPPPSYLPPPLSGTNFPIEPVINLSATVANRPTHLSWWFQNQIDSEWQTLDWLFESASQPTMRLRSAFHLRDQAFLKRFKPINFSSFSNAVRVLLIVAVSRDTPDLYKVCVQVQPKKDDGSLPQQLLLKLLNMNQNVLATVHAKAEDTYLQLPYFRGEQSNSFIIELSINSASHCETFII